MGTSLPDQIEGDLYNLSASGCSIRVSQGAVQVHDEVWFKIDTIEPWKGTVRWVSKQNVGVEFDRPLFQSLFELIAHAHQPVAMSRAA